MGKDDPLARTILRDPSCDPFPATESVTQLFDHLGIGWLLTLPALIFAGESLKCFLAMYLEILGNRKVLKAPRNCFWSSEGRSENPFNHPVGHHRLRSPKPHSFLVSRTPTPFDVGSPGCPYPVP